MFQNTPRQISTDFFGQKLTLQSGLLAQQATASILATIGGTSVLCAVVVGGESRGDYFPLQVIYEERYYAAGKIKSSQWSKREARPSDNAILTGRMIDRSLRSLFDADIRTEIQVIITVMSLDKINPPDTLSVLAASAALQMCNFEPKISHITTSQVKGLQENLELAPVKNIYINFDTKKQIYAIRSTSDNDTKNLISLGAAIISTQTNYKAYLLIDNQESSNPQEITNIEAFINEEEDLGVVESLKRAVSKSIQLGFDVTNTPIVFNSQFVPGNYNDYQLYRGPVASVRIGYTSPELTIDKIDNLMNTVLPLYSQVQTLTELQNLNETTQNLLKQLNHYHDKQYLAKINKILTQKSPQLGIYFKNLIETYKDNAPSNEGKIVSNFEVNPSYKYLQSADLDIVISGNGDNIVMVECGANIVDESIISEALNLSIAPIKQLISLQADFLKLD